MEKPAMLPALSTVFLVVFIYVQLLRKRWSDMFWMSDI